MRYDANDDQALLSMVTWHYQEVITVAITWGCYMVMRAYYSTHIILRAPPSCM